MDPVTLTIATIGFTLATVGTVTLVAWRYERSRARVPATLLLLAVAVLATPAVIGGGTASFGPTPQDAADPAEHPADAVVPAELITRR